MPVATEAPPDRAEVGKMISRLKNKRWRMRNLYQILTTDEAKEGDKSSGEAKVGGNAANLSSGAKKVVPFVVREEQERFYKERHTRNFVPKSRKYGISTAVVLDYLDDCIFANPTRPIHAAHVDFRDDDAQEKLEIARFAWTQGPLHPDPVIAAIWEGLHNNNPLLTDNAGELKWQNGSKQQASTSFMGGTPDRLHISEFGPLSAQQPDRAVKVMRGTINAAPTYAIIDIETTMEGGTFGECAAIFDLALQNESRRDALNPLEWKMFFIPWWKHPDYILPGHAPMLEKTREYFREIGIRYQVAVPLDRQAWYETVKQTQRQNMFTQFPTVVAECLYAGAGAAYFEADGLLWQQNRITGIETTLQFGELVLQGEARDMMNRSVSWQRRDERAAWLRVLEHPLPGRKYLLWADSGVGKQAAGSDDTKRDTHAYGIIRDAYIDPFTSIRELPAIVACCYGDDPNDKTNLTGDRCPTVEMIRRVLLLSIYYGDCMVVPEINNKDDIALRMIAAGVKNMYVQGMVGADGAMAGLKKSQEVFGWLTDEGSRRQMLEHMQMETIQQRWHANFKTIQQQMSVFVVNKKGRPEAAPGEHDDFVLGPAIGLFNLPHATRYNGPEQRTYMQYRQDYIEMHCDPRGI